MSAWTGTSYAGEIVIDEKADPLVDHQFLHQRGADAHGHRADDLAARRFGIEDTSRCTNGEHAADADFSRWPIDADFHEMGAEGRLLDALVEIAIFDRVLRDEIAVACAARPAHGAVAAERTCRLRTRRQSELKPSLCATASRSFMQAA